MKAMIGHACLAASAALLCFTLAPLCPAQSGYGVSENGVGTGSESGGPVRMARVSYASGTISYRASDSVDWSSATINAPLRQGAELWAKSGRAEIQFDDGSTMRLGGGGAAVLQTMYSDSKGEFTEIKFDNGLATLNLRSKYSEYQIDTPQCAVKAYGPAEVRIGVNGSFVEVVVRSGEAEIDSSQGTQVLKKGQRVQFGTASSGSSSTRTVAYSHARHRGGYYVRGGASGYNGSNSYGGSSSYGSSGDYSGASYSSSSYYLSAAPAYDNWDTWCGERDAVCYHHNPYLAADINICAGDLDLYGHWHSSKYGEVWCPTESADWSPYRTGSWDWVAPFGWTYCGAEPWGWAPYHYGTWFRASWGWSWCPGPAYQYWSPAVVDFCDDGANVAWAPLCPWEVHYPAAFSIGFASGDWALSFSIGQAGCFFPTGAGFCVGRPWGNAFVNRTTNVFNVTTINNFYGQTVAASGGAFGVNNRFRPFNAFSVNGATVASRTAFATGGRFQSLSTRQAAIFNRGRSFTALPRGGSQLSGPLGVRPRPASFSPTHRPTSARPTAGLFQKPVFRSANMPAKLARFGGNPGRTMRASNRAIANPTRAARNPAVANNMRSNAANSRMASNRANSAANRVATNAGNRYSRFNNMSRSRFTNSQRNATRNAMAVAHNGAANRGNRVPMNRAAGANRSVANRVGANRAAANRVAMNRAASRAHANAAMGNPRRAGSNGANAARRNISTARRNIGRAPTRNFGRAARPAIRRSNMSRSIGRSARPSMRRPSMPRSFGGSRPSMRRPSMPRSFGGSRPSMRRPSMPRSFGGSRPSMQRPSMPRSFGGGRPQALRSFGGGRPSMPRSFGGGRPSAPRSFGGGRAPSRPSAPSRPRRGGH